MTAQPAVEISDDPQALADAVAARTLDTLRAALEQRPIAHLLLTGGSILEQVFAQLADREALQWSRVHVWWGDERYVPAGSDERNDVPARAAFLNALPAVLHPMPASDGEFGDDVDAAARAYGTELVGFAQAGEAFPRPDVALIGVGPDGHCCSLFPHHPGLAVADVSVTAIRNSPKPPPTRLSVTFPMLESVRNLWFVVSGDGKADAVGRALAGAPREQIPSGSVRGSDATVWMLDSAAASRVG